MEAVEDDGDKIAVSFITPCQPVDNTVGTAVESLERYIDIVIIKEDLELGTLRCFCSIVRFKLSEIVNPDTLLPGFIVKNPVDGRRCCNSCCSILFLFSCLSAYNRGSNQHTYKTQPNNSHRKFSFHSPN